MEVSGTPKTNRARGTGLEREVMSSGSGALNFELPSKDPGGDVKKPAGMYGTRTQRRGKSYRDHLRADVNEERDVDFKRAVCVCFLFVCLFVYCGKTHIQFTILTIHQ